MNETYKLELIFDRPSMEAIAASELFNNSRENVYHVVKEARYIRNTVEEVFVAE